MTGADHDEELWPQANMSQADMDIDLAGASVPAGLHRDGLSWSWELDLDALVAAVTDPAPWQRGPRTPSQSTTPAAPDYAPGGPDATPATPDTGPAIPVTSPPAGDAPSAEPDPVEAEFAEYLEAAEAGQSPVIPLTMVAGRIAESVPAGPELAAWADAGRVADLEDGALAGIAMSYRRLASWAQAGELAAVAELTARSAAADDRIGIDEHGCPARIPDSASAEVSLALTMSQSAASWWTDLAVTLRWRLAATGAALRNGTIDLARARAIAEATAALDEDTARAVQDRVLPRAGSQTMGQLRAALRRAVIAADPAGADRRREEAERRARVMLYPDPDGTASLAGYNLPGINATAAMARVTALARALKASGAGGGIDLLRAQVFLGLLLGTLPYIPPPENAPPDTEPPEPDDPPSHPPGDIPPGGIGAGGGSGPDSGFGGGDGPGAWEADDVGLGARPPPAWPEVPAFLPPGPAAMGGLPPAGGKSLDLRVPWTTVTGHPSEPGYLSRLGPITPAQATHLTGLATQDPGVRWRVIVTDQQGQAIAVARLRSAPGQPADPATGLVGQVTVTISPDNLTIPPADVARLPPALNRVLAAAHDAIARAAQQAPADTTAGGCAHTEATAAYRPTRYLWDLVTARDLTCRFRTCRQPAARCDLDHTTPFDQGGLTCWCNLGAGCRFHHKVKQHPGWRLDQPTPGTFIWTTPTGRQYLVQPDTHAA